MNNKDVNPNWDHWITEDDDAATVQKMGARIAKQEPVKFGGKTKVSVSPKTVEQTPDQTTRKPPFGVGKSYNKSDDPVRNRPSSVDYPQQNGPTNPVRQPGLKDMWKQADLERSTREAQRRQNPNRKNYPWG
jgi:hypothetical protein